MSVEIPLNKLSAEQKSRIKKDLYVKEVLSKSAPEYAQPKILRDFFIDGETRTAYIPFAYARQHFGVAWDATPNRLLNFNGQLRDYQVEPVKEVLDNLREHGSAILSAYCGFGKTISSLYIASRIGGPVAVLTHRKNLSKQWEEGIAKFITGAGPYGADSAGAGSFRVDSKQAGPIGVDSKQAGSCGVDIISVHVIKNYTREELAKYHLLIVDEIHVMCATTFTEAMLYFTPKYTLGLSATPTRPDGMDVILDHHFNKQYMTVIKKDKPVDVRVYWTGIIPEHTQNRSGGVDWSSLVNFLAENPEFNDRIISELESMPEKRFMVLCSRKSQIKILAEKCEERGIDATTYYESMKAPKNPDARVLIGTTSKLGVGFDDTTRNAMIFACDIANVENLEQYAGRVVHRTTDTPLIIDFVHNFTSLKRHWDTRKKYYKSIGASLELVGFPARGAASGGAGTSLLRPGK